MYSVGDLIRVKQEYYRSSNDYLCSAPYAIVANVIDQATIGLIWLNLDDVIENSNDTYNSSYFEKVI